MLQINYGGKQESNKQPKMKEFIFFTTQGYTFDPNNQQITNMQILGSAEGQDI